LAFEQCIFQSNLNEKNLRWLSNLVLGSLKRKLETCFDFEVQVQIC